MKKLMTGIRAVVFCSLSAALVAACGGGDPETVTKTVEVCPLTDCSGACVDTQNDPANCGACGMACGTGEYCVAGSCTAQGCPSNTTDCGGSCVDTQNDPANCGGCGTACDASQICSGGTCADRCLGGSTECNGVCVDTNNDGANCGGCGTACDPGEVCNGAGTCALTCQTGFIDCNGTCVDPQTNGTYCGASMDCQGANAGTTCASGESCNAGVCEPSCQVGQIDCNGSCIDPTNDEGYCGASLDCQGANAGVVCGGGEICSGSACTPSCGTGLALCNGNCVDPQFDTTYCGADAACNGGTTCTAQEFCDNGTCTAITQGGNACAATNNTTTMPAQVSTFPGNVRGYWFTALSDFVITGVNIPDLTGDQNIQVMRFNSGPPPLWSATTTDYTTLAYIQQNPSTGFINVCIPVFTGDVIGVLGQRGTTTSYATSPATVTIDGQATTIERLLYQGSINTSPAGDVATESGGSIGRIELQTAPF